MKDLKTMTRDEVLDFVYDNFNKKWEEGDELETGTGCLYEDGEVYIEAEVEVKNMYSSTPRGRWTPAEEVQRAEVFVKTLNVYTESGDEYKIDVNEEFEYEDIWQEG